MRGANQVAKTHWCPWAPRELATACGLGLIACTTVRIQTSVRGPKAVVVNLWLVLRWAGGLLVITEKVCHHCFRGCTSGHPAPLPQADQEEGLLVLPQIHSALQGQRQSHPSQERLENNPAGPVCAQLRQCLTVSRATLGPAGRHHIPNSAHIHSYTVLSLL